MSTQMNFAISMASAIISLLLHGGTVVLNFIVSVVSFLPIACVCKILSLKVESYLAYLAR